MVAECGDHAYFGVGSATPGGEQRRSRQNLSDRRASSAELAAPKRDFHVCPGGLGPQSLFADDLLQLGFTPGSDGGAPLLIYGSVGRDPVDEILDRVALVAERRAGIDPVRDLVADLLVRTTEPVNLFGSFAERGR